MWLKTCYFCIYPLSNLHDKHYGISTRKTPAYVRFHVAYSKIPKDPVRLALCRPACVDNVIMHSCAKVSMVAKFACADYNTRSGGHAMSGNA